MKSEQFEECRNIHDHDSDYETELIQSDPWIFVPQRNEIAYVSTLYRRSEIPLNWEFVDL